jgi:hypothetical protein
MYMGDSNNIQVNEVFPCPFLQIHPVKERNGGSQLALIICNTKCDHLNSAAQQ